MEELFELREYMEQQNYAAALTLIGEMEEMSRDDKIHKIYSYAIVLLLHLIKQEAEQRSTRSWEFSIHNSVRAINLVNRRRKTKGFYLTQAELLEILAEAYQTALERAALETFEGRHDEVELATRVAEEQIKQKAMQLIQAN